MLASSPVAVNQTLSPVGTLYAGPVAFFNAEYAPNGTWFVATYAVLQTQDFDFGSPEYNNTSVRLGIWRTDSWAMVEERPVTTLGNMSASRPSSLPLFLRISPDGSRILMWYDGAEDFRSLRMLAFPGFAGIENTTFSENIYEVEWDPSGSEIAVATASYPQKGGLYVLRASDLSTRSYHSEENVTLVDVSWSADSEMLAAYAHESGLFPFSQCGDTWMPVNDSIRVMRASDLSTLRTVWSADVEGEPCGMGREENVWWGHNGSAQALFHPTQGYMLRSNGTSIAVVNTTFWATVFESNLTCDAGGTSQVPIVYAGSAWLGETMDFSYVVDCFVDTGNATGWEAEAFTDRAVFRAAAHSPTAIVDLEATNGSAHLYPGFASPPLSLGVELDSHARLYSAVWLTATAANASWSIRYDVGSRVLSIPLGDDLVALDSWGVEAPWDGHAGRFSIVLRPTWNLSVEGAWLLGASVVLWDGSIGNATASGNVSTHVEFHLVGPLTVLDGRSGRLDSGRYVNASPSLTFEWVDARFIHGEHPLNASGFAVAVRAAGGTLATLSLSGASMTATLALPAGAVDLRLELLRPAGGGTDRTNLGIPLLVDGGAPIVVIADPADGSWWALTTAVVRFNATDAAAGVNLFSATVSTFASGGNGAQSVTGADALLGSNGAPFAAFSATAVLATDPLGALRLLVEVSDEVGNRGSAEIFLQIDRQPPSVHVEVWDGWVVVAQLVVAWTCEDAGVGFDDRTIAASYRSPQGADTAYDATVVSRGDGTLTLEATILPDEGTGGQLRVECMDRLGNRNETAAIPLDVDRTPPDLLAVSPPAHEILVGTNHSLGASFLDVPSGIESSRATCHVSVDGGMTYGPAITATVTALPNGSSDVSCPLALVEGDVNRVTVQISDAAGNAAEYGPFSLRVNVAPTAAILFPRPSASLFGGSVHLEGEVSDLDGDIVSIEWYDVLTGQRLGEGATINVIRSAGSHEVELRVTDSAGHVRIDRRAFSVSDPPTAGTEGIWLWVAILVAAAAAIVAPMWWRNRPPRE